MADFEKNLQKLKKSKQCKLIFSVFSFASLQTKKRECQFEKTKRNKINLGIKFSQNSFLMQVDS